MTKIGKYFQSIEDQRNFWNIGFLWVVWSNKKKEEEVYEMFSHEFSHETRLNQKLE